MKKVDVILVVTNSGTLELTLNYLNFEAVNIAAILMDGGDGKVLTVNNTQQIPIYSFSFIKQAVEQGKNICWLVCGGWFDTENVRKFLVKSSVSKENIINFSVYNHITPAWIANIRYTEKNPIDFFSTGISYTEVGLDVNCFPKMYGVNLACSSQDLRQGYWTAEHVFKNSPGKIKFVLIGVTPYTFDYDASKSFAVYPRELQFIWTLKNSENPIPPPPHIILLNELVSDSAKKTFSNISEEQADLNYIGSRNNNNSPFPASAVMNWQEELTVTQKKFRADTFTENVHILEEYIKLCLKNDAKPIAINFPFAPILRENYSQEILIHFRNILRQFEKIYDFHFVDLFDLPLDYSCFYNSQHLNLKGSYLASSFLAYELCRKNILRAENFRAMEKSFFENLSCILSKEDYSHFTKKIFGDSITLP